MCATHFHLIPSQGVRGKSKREWHGGAHPRRIVWRNVLSKGVSVVIVVLLLIALGLIPLCQVFGITHTSGLKANSKHVDSEREFDEFFHWAQERGLQVSKKVKVARFPPDLVGTDVDVWGPHVSQGHAMHQSIPGGVGVRGLVAVEGIGEGEMICTIPHARLSLTSPTPPNTRPSPERTHPSWAALAVHLLNERMKGATSAWAPYLNILPPYSPLPLSLPPHLWEEVQWPAMERQLSGMREEIENAYAAVVHPQFGLEDFVWAVSMVHSRAFSLGGREVVMVPFMDAINHRHDNNAEWSLEATRSEQVEIVTRRRIRKGEEVVVSFGPRSNDNLLLFYGFVLDNNPFDVVRLFPHFEAAIAWQLDSHCMCKRMEGKQEGAIEDMAEECEEAPALSTKHAFARATESMKQFRDRVDGGSARLVPAINASDWWDLINVWGDLGYEYMPYSPGPDVRPRGLVDPNLVAALSARWEEQFNSTQPRRGGGDGKSCQRFVHRLRKLHGSNSAGLSFDPGDVCRMEGSVDVAATRTSLVSITRLVFGLCGRKRRRWRELVVELKDYIQEILCDASRGRVNKSGDVEHGRASTFFARLEIAMRALELLAAHATSVERDMMILSAPPVCDDKGGSQKISHDGTTCTGTRKAIVKHRYVRKRMLIACVHKLLSIPN